MKALILAAGYAVRLKELTLDTPKPLLEIGGRRIIDRLIDKVVNIEGLDSLYIITNGKFFEKFNDWLKNSARHDKISLLNDGSVSNETRLGAIKDLAIAVGEGRIDEDLLVIAGDNLFEFDLGEFLKFAQARRDGVSIALYDIRDYELAKRFGVVKVNGHKKIIDFEEKPDEPKSTLISTGIYYFPKEKLPFIKKYLASSDSSDAPGYYIGWLSKKDIVYGFAFSEDWYDIGDIESYKKANSKYLKKENS